jgi:hypothetical protein
MTDSEEAERTWSRESFCILEGSGPDSLFIELKMKSNKDFLGEKWISLFHGSYKSP